jgi:polygalacturonase
MTLELLAGAVIVASPRDADFDPLEKLPYDPFADNETADQYFAVLAGDGLEGITVLGPGTIDGNRAQRGGPKLVGLKRCRNVRVAGLRLVNSPNYALSLLGCEGVQVADVVVENSYADGIDPDCCTDVTVTGCQVDSFDDGICVKSSLSLGSPTPTRNVVVRGCTVHSSTNCLKIGTETGSDVRDVTFSDCVLHGRPVPGASLAEAEGGGIAIEMVDGATLDGVTVTNLTLHDVHGPLFVRLGNRGRGQAPSPRPGVLRNVTIADVTATGASETSSITGVPGGPVEGVRLTRVSIASRGGGPAGPGLAVDEQAGAYP